MPAYRLTANCIWNSFQSSNKKHLIITGTRNTGKTTLLQKLFPDKIPGIKTWAQPKSAVYIMDNLTGEKTQVGFYDDALPGTENKMRPLLSGFDVQGVSILDSCAHNDSEWIYIDEIGYLETNSKDYCNAILNLMKHKRVAAVVRKQEFPFLQMLCNCEDVFLIDLDHPFGNMGCVIMASGEGKRFGGNKLMVDFNGKPMIQCILEATDRIFSRRVVVTRHKEVQLLCSSLDVEVVLHDLPYRSDTIRLGLDAVGMDTDGCMFCPGDQPLLHWNTVAAQALCAVNSNNTIWRTAFETIQGSPTLFPRYYYFELLQLPVGKGGSVILKKYPHLTNRVLAGSEWELKDIDTPKDMELLLDHSKQNV